MENQFMYQLWMSGTMSEKMVNDSIEFIHGYEFTKETLLTYKRMNSLIDLDSEYFERLKKGLKEYYILLLKYPKVEMYSIEIDELWHAHILDTKAYFTFCEKIFGGYLHHTPKLESENGKSVEELSKEIDFSKYPNLFCEYGNNLATLKVWGDSNIFSACGPN